jgi:hypothetical protein
MYFRAKNTLKNNYYYTLKYPRYLWKKNEKLNFHYKKEKKRFYDTFRFGGLDSPYIFKLVRFGGLDIVFQWEF